MRWRDRAVDDLEGIDAWLSSLEHGNPARVRAHIGAALKSLERLGDIGRPSSQRGFRELSVRGAPYVIVYEMDGADIDVVALYHTSQER